MLANLNMLLHSEKERKKTYSQHMLFVWLSLIKTLEMTIPFIENAIT